MSNAQEGSYRFLNITARDGFNPAIVTSMIQDRKGYIWYGSLNGLYKYDGYKTERHVNKYNKQNTISENSVYSIVEDKDGNIWISTATEGVNCFDPIKKRFTQYRHKKGDNNSIVSNRMKRLYIDSKNRLWIGYAGDGWTVYDLKTKNMRHYLAKPTNINFYGFDGANTPDPFLEDRNGGMWITSACGLHFHDTNNHIVTYHDINRKNAPTPDNLFISILQTDDTTLWLGTWGAGLKKFNTRTKQFTQYLYDKINPVASIHNIVLQIVPKTGTELWVGTADKGLGIFDMVSGKFRFIPHDPENPESPLPGECYKLLKDKSGTLWAGFYSGLSRIILTQKNIKRTAIRKSTREYNKTFYPAAFFKDTASGLLYVGCISGKGLYIIDDKTDDETIVKVPDSKVRFSEFDAVSISAIVPLNSQELLLATNLGICVYQKSTRKIRRIRIRDQEGKPVYALEFLKANDGYWCNSYPTNGYYFINNELTTGVHYGRQKTSPVNFTSPRQHVVYVENDTLIWVSVFDSGLYRMNPATNSLKLINNKADKTFFGKCLLKGPDAGYWFCTENQGVFSLKREQNDSFTIRQYGEEAGLASEYLTNAVLDKNNRIVVSTYGGPSVYFEHQDRFVSYSVNNLISDNRVEFSEVYCADDGYLYVGTVGEYLTWHPDSVMASLTIPDLYLTSVKIFDKEYNDTIDVEKLSAIEIPYDRNTVSVAFTALDFAAPQAIQYAYKMDGINENWEPVGSDRTVTFSRLAPDKYTLHVKAISGMGLAANKEITLQILINPPFWRTWWFILLCVIVVTVIIIAIFRYRVAAIRKEEDTKTKFSKMMAEVEMKALRAQMNPHFLFNCLNSINRYIVVNDTVNASGYLTKFSKLIRLILDNSANDATSLDNEIALLRLYIEMEFMRFDGKFTYDISIDKSLSCETISIPSMIIQPYIENAIWHGLLNKGVNGHLLVTVAGKGPGELEVIIEDNGIGREKAKEMKSKSTLKQKSYGMKITNDRIKAMNQLYDAGASVTIEDLKSADNEPRGTRVILKIPYTKLATESGMLQFL
ncbi:MAG: histidine kinase [Taibaiella sp.]|nr:histidine kinase [Taibaiella sp.]